MKEEEVSLIDVCYHNGTLCKKVEHPNGEVEYLPLKEEGNDPFESTKMKPSTWADVDTEILVPNEAGEQTKTGLTRVEHFERSCRIEAVLVKWLSPRMSDGKTTQTIDTKGDVLLKNMLTDLCKAFGSPYSDIKIK